MRCHRIFLFAPLVADLFLYCNEKKFMLSLDKQSQADVISAFKDTSRYLDDIFNIDNPFFDNVVPIMYPKEPKLSKANTPTLLQLFLI